MAATKRNAPKQNGSLYDPADRKSMIRALEAQRQSKVICFLTGMRPGAPSTMAEDQVRIIFDHLLALKKRPIERLDIFLCSNGGSATVPWRLVSLFREFSKHFAVLIPYRAYSAATMLALGADEIVMHPFGEMGPIDPTVSNEFNPKDEQTQQRLGISVEDVKAYVTFIKQTVGITHEEELVRAIEILARKVHPLALGNVERFLSQSRMMGRKIMRTHMSESEEHTINDIIENLASKLFFHGHPINRKEAKQELRLKVADNVPSELETLMWDLYLNYELELQNREVFNPMGDLAQVTGGVQAPKTIEYKIKHAVIESLGLKSHHETWRRFTEVQIPPNPFPQIKEDILFQGWIHS